MFRRALEAAAVTLLGALAGYWIEWLLPTRIRHAEAYRVVVLERAIWWAGIAALGYFAWRFWEIVRHTPPASGDEDQTIQER